MQNKSVSVHLELLEGRIASGFLLDSAQPGLLVSLRVYRGLLESGLLPRFEVALAQWMPAYTPMFAGSARGPEDFLNLVLRLLDALQEQAGSPVFSRSRHTLVSSDGSSWTAALLCPVLGTNKSAHAHAFTWLMTTLNHHTGERFTEEDRQAFDAILGRFAREAPQGAMSTRILQAAVAAGIPWLHLVDNVYQLGWGCRSRLLDSTFTDRTSNIGTRIARCKSSTSYMLRIAGFPVPKQLPAGSAEQAREHAARLGYPVVVKPDAEDGGRGVAAGLCSATAVHKAYDRARQHSDRILVEKHVEGQDYRVYVFEGEVVQVVLRIPGSVVGNGRQSVGTLLAQVNADPRRHQLGRWQPIALDEEARDLLNEQGLDVEAIPAAGQRVRLRRTANIHSGGTPEEIPLAAVHPENLLLCARAANLLRLDLAGVDLLMPDIGISWRESTAGICEVNAQPQMPPELPALLLGRLVSGKGRIPVALLVDNRAALWLQDVTAALAAAGISAGLATAQEVRVAGRIVAAPIADSAAAAQVLLTDPLLELAIFQVADLNTLKNGMPVDRCDLLILSGDENLAPLTGTLAGLCLPRSTSVWVDSASSPWQGAGIRGALVQALSASAVAEALLRLCEDL